MQDRSCCQVPGPGAGRRGGRAGRGSGKPHNEAEIMRRGGNWAADRAPRGCEEAGWGKAGVPGSALWAWAEEVWGPVCAECALGKGCVDAAWEGVCSRVWSAEVEGKEFLESQEHPLHKGKLSAARAQSPCGNGSDPHGGFWRQIQPGLLARRLTHEGRDSFWVLTAPSPRSFPGTDVFPCVLSQRWSQSSVSWQTV